MPGISGHQVDLTRFIGSGSGADKLRIITSFPFIIFIPHPFLWLSSFLILHFSFLILSFHIHHPTFLIPHLFLSLSSFLILHFSFLILYFHYLHSSSYISHSSSFPFIIFILHPTFLIPHPFLLLSSFLILLFSSFISHSPFNYLHSSFHISFLIIYF